MLEKPRIGSIDDALRCAEIVNNWVESTKWMPKLYSKQELLEMIEEAILDGAIENTYEDAYQYMMSIKDKVIN